MSVFLAPVANEQQVNANGAPLSGGTIEVYLAGTSTPSTTYSDKAGMVPNTWPIVLNTLGVNNQGEVWLTGGAAYKLVIKDSVGIVQRTLDNVSGINDTTVTADQWIVYPGAPTYVSATSFTVAGDQTQIFQVGRRIRTQNTGGLIYSTITISNYSAPNTTVTVVNDSGVLDSGLSQVSYGVLPPQQTSIPGGLPIYAQCELVKSGANIILLPKGGNRVTVNESILIIPAAGVSLAPAGSVAGTNYYIYLYQGASGPALEFSATAPATDPVTGMRNKTGDNTRLLVGRSRAITGPAWQDTPAQRFVSSWFNRKNLSLRTANGGSFITLSTSPVEAPVALRNEFLAWAGDSITTSVSGTSANNNAGSSSTSAIYLDGTTNLGSTAPVSSVANAAVNCGVTTTTIVTDGYHYSTLFISVSAGTGTWAGDVFVSTTVPG